MTAIEILGRVSTAETTRRPRWQPPGCFMPMNDLVSGGAVALDHGGTRGRSIAPTEAAPT